MNKIFIEKIETGFSQISNNILRDPNLSSKAKGIFATILSFSNEWDFSVKGLVSVVKEGKAAVYAAISELIELGYCRREECHKEGSNLICGYNYSFSWSKDWENIEKSSRYTDFRDTEVRDTDSRYPENQDKINTRINKEQKNKYIPPIIPQRGANVESEAVARIYVAYPAKDVPTAKYPKGRSLGKSAKDKDRIARILKSGKYTEEQLLSIIARYVEEHKENGFMQNFSTFLNNIPDYEDLDMSSPSQPKEEKIDYEQRDRERRAWINKGSDPFNMPEWMKREQERKRAR